MKFLGRYKGSVTEYDIKKSFGFIKIEEEGVDGMFYKIKQKMDEVFIYYKDIEPEKEGFKKLFQGMIVEFDLHNTNNGYKAFNLNIIGTNYDEFGEVNFNK